MDTIVHEERGGDTTVLRLEGPFDTRAAQEVGQRVREMGSSPVRIDFSQVRGAADVAVALLARALGENVELVGLGQHQVRLLRYCGYPAEGLARAAGR
jgi:hypothetical protein